MVSVLSKAMAEKVSYVDDMTLLASTENDLKDAFGVMVPYLEATMQELNVTKTYVIHVNHLLPEIVINDMRLPSKEKVKILGVIFSFRDGRVWLRYDDADLKWIETTAARIRCSPLPWWYRTLVAGSLIVGKANYGGEFRMLTATQERSIRATMTAVLWKTPGKHRSPAVIHTILTRGHVTDITQAALTTRWMTYRRLILNDPTIAAQFWACKLKSKTRQRILGRGPVEALLAAERRLGIDWMEPGVICIGDTVLDLFTCTRGTLGHHLREAARRMVWTQARQDARRGLLEHEEAHLQDLGAAEGVDLTLTLKLYNTLDPQRKGVLRQILANAVWTRHARAQHPENRGMSAVCIYCDDGEIENIHHLWWRCSAWARIRNKYFPGVENIVERFRINTWPSCTRSCGIFNYVHYDCLAENVQNMMIDIYMARLVEDRLAADRQGVG